MRGSSRRWLPWMPWAASLVLSGIELWLLAINLDAPVGPRWGPRGFSAVLTLPFSTVGALILSRHPRHGVGWLLAWIGLLSGVYGFSEEYAAYGLLAAPGRLPGAEIVAWVAAWIWVAIAVPALTFLPLLFPNGHLPSPKWRPAIWLSLGGMLFLGGSIALAPGPLLNQTYQQNPLGLEAIPPWLTFQEARHLVTLPLLIAVLACISALLQRYRRSRGLARLQMKWFLFAGTLATITVWPASVLPSQVLPLVLIASMFSVPVSIGIAILRYHLYDVDLVINRTIVYGLLTASLAGLYFVGIALLQAILRALTGQESDLAVVGSTLAIAAAFAPLRRRIQAAIDRRFYRHRYDAARALVSFGAALREEVDLNQLMARLQGVVEETIQPSHMTLWIGPAARREGGNDERNI